MAAGLSGGSMRLVGLEAMRAGALRAFSWLLLSDGTGARLRRIRQRAARCRARADPDHRHLAWSPPSPDPSGITYRPDTGELSPATPRSRRPSRDLAYQGVNVWTHSLTGEVSSTFTTVGHSNEPPASASIPPAAGSGTRTTCAADLPGRLRPGRHFGTADDVVLELRNYDDAGCSTWKTSPTTTSTAISTLRGEPADLQDRGRPQRRLQRRGSAGRRRGDRDRRARRRLPRPGRHRLRPVLELPGDRRPGHARPLRDHARRAASCARST